MPDRVLRLGLKDSRMTFINGIEDGMEIGRVLGRIFGREMIERGFGGV